MQGHYESREGTEGVQYTATGRKIYHCDECGRRKLKKELFRIELFDLPWHDKPRIAYFCKEAPRDIQERAGVESCEELLTSHGWSDFRYFTCCECNRMICEQHPGNGWHTQYRETEDGEQICLKCFEADILKNGTARDKFERGSLEGMFFSGDNHELRDAGFVAVVDYAHVASTARAKELCKQAIELIDSGKIVVVAYESMAIGGLEGNISMWAKDAWLECPECQTANHYHGGGKLGNHLINEHHFSPAETVDLVKDAERVVMEAEPEELKTQGSCQTCQKYKLDVFTATPEAIAGACGIDGTKRAPTTECVYPNGYKARELPEGSWKLIAGRGTLGDLNWGPSKQDPPRERLQEQLVELAMHVTETVLLSGGGGPGSSTAILLGAEIKEEPYGLRLQVYLRDVQGAVNMETFDPFIDSWQISVKEATHAG